MKSDILLISHTVFHLLTNYIEACLFGCREGILIWIIKIHIKSNSTSFNSNSTSRLTKTIQITNYKLKASQFLYSEFCFCCFVFFVVLYSKNRSFFFFFLSTQPFKMKLNVSSLSVDLRIINIIKVHVRIKLWLLSLSHGFCNINLFFGPCVLFIIPSEMHS